MHAEKKKKNFSKFLLNKINYRTYSAHYSKIKFTQNVINEKIIIKIIIYLIDGAY